MQMDTRCARDTYIVAGTNPDPFPVSGIAFSVASYSKSITYVNTDFLLSFAEAQMTLKDKDFILLADNRMPGLNRRLPGTKFDNQIQEWLSTNPSFVRKTVGLIAGYPLWLYVRNCNSGN